MTTALGLKVKTYSYDAFGRITESGIGGGDNSYTYTAREYDTETGLYYYRARYYDPKAGRFITKDPISFAGGDVNLYAYVGNNPVNWVDPSGMLWGSVFTRGGGKGILSGGTGAYVGGITGGFIGAGLGTATGIPGMGFLGGVAGGWVGGKIGGYFDDECAGQLNCKEEIPPPKKKEECP